jgi:hypothetical protein
MGFKKSQLFIEFPFIWLNNLKLVEGRKLNIFHLKYSFCHPFFLPWDSAVGGGHTIHHQPITPLLPIFRRSLLSRIQMYNASYARQRKLS